MFNTPTRVSGEFSVIFNGHVTEHEVNIVYVFLKNKFKNFYADSISCGRHSVNVQMNYIAEDLNFQLHTFFDELRALDPNKINTVRSDDGLSAVDADFEEDVISVTGISAKGDIVILPRDAVVTDEMTQLVKDYLSKKLIGFSSGQVVAGGGTISVNLDNKIATSRVAAVVVQSEILDDLKALHEAFQFIDGRDLAVVADIKKDQ